MKTSFALAIVWLGETELVLQTLPDFVSQERARGAVSATSERPPGCLRELPKPSEPYEKLTNHVEQLSLVLEYLKI